MKPQIHFFSIKNDRYCDAMRSLMEKHQIPFTEIAVDDDDDAKALLEQRTGSFSVPAVVAFDQESGTVVGQVIGYQSDIEMMRKALALDQS